MVGSGLNREESVGSQCEDRFANLERRRDREVNQIPSVHTTHTSRSHSRIGSHVSHGEETLNLRLEIDHLCKKLRRKHRKTSPFSSKTDSSGDSSYKPRSRTPLSESFSLSSQLDKEERYHKKKDKSPTPRSMGNDAMNKALSQISKSPFTHRIDRAKLPYRFMQPTFTIYNGRTNPVEHVSHLNQRMVVHLRNEALMYNVFPFILGLVMIRWFDGLDEGLISSFEELTRAFGARFVTCNKVPRPLNCLLSMVMRKGETLKTYSDRYWEIVNEIDGDFEDMAIRTFKVSLPIENDLRKSLIMKPM